MGPGVRGPGEVSFRVNNGLLPLVGTDDSHLGHQLVFADLYGAVAGGPMSEKPLRSEGRRAEKLKQQAHTLDRSQDLLDAPAGHALAMADRLDSDR